MISIQPQYLSLSKLLDGRLFVVPEYQRSYSWTSKERRDLFDDIMKIHAKGPEEGHFMAAVVCLRRRKEVLGTDEYHVVEIVDGQQRLTTLIILLNCMRLSLGIKEKVELKLGRELKELLVKNEADELLLLQTNHDSSQHFANFLRKGSSESSKTANTIADREILKAIEECQAFIDSWKENGDSLPALASLLKNHLYFLFHEIDDEKSVYTVFEVLNSRGLDVSWLDRMKSILMGSAFELQKSNRVGVIHDLHTVWREIYRVIGLRQGLSTEALRYSATLWASDAQSRPLGEEDAVDLLRSKSSNAKKIRDTASWLLRVTQACDRVTANPRIDAVTRIAQARLLATAILLRDDLGLDEKKNILARWERVSFRIYGMLRYDARTRVGEYVRLAWSVVNDKLSAKSIDDAIRNIGDEFSIDDAIKQLESGNCYEGWESELRYFMYRYEEHLASKQNLNFANEQWEKIWMVSPVDSIEHIWAKSKAPEKHKHRLGNLVLLPPRLNSKLQDIDPVEKVTHYRKTGLLIAESVASIIEERGWKVNTIDQREEEILKWAKKEWGD